MFINFNPTIPILIYIVSPKCKIMHSGMLSAKLFIIETMGKPKCFPLGKWLNKYSASIP